MNSDSFYMWDELFDGMSLCKIAIPQNFPKICNSNGKAGGSGSQRYRGNVDYGGAGPGGHHRRGSRCSVPTGKRGAAVHRGSEKGQLERPQILIVDGGPTSLYVATGINPQEGFGSCSHVFKLKVEQK